MKNKYIVKDTMILMDYLINILCKSRKKAKSLLTNGAIYVNGKNITKYNYPLLKGYIVEIKEYANNDLNLDILYEDKNIIVVNKRCGLLTISTDNEDERTLYHLVSEYVKEKNKNARVFIIHRLDKDTSGIIMFAKNENIKKLYQDNWDNLVKLRKYYAVVSEKPICNKKRIVNYLAENDNFKVYSTTPSKGKNAITEYKIIKSNNKYSLLDINIETGRKNQIRVAMHDIGNPIVGDRKYGSKEDPLRRLGLHAYKLVVVNPLNNKELEFFSPMPNKFKNLIK